MRIAVLMGGKSSEREVSLRSGKAVAAALRNRGYDTIELDAEHKVPMQLEEIKPDLAFIALHGRFGEDGAIQGLLEIMGIPYTGSGIAASAVCMDKILSKQLFVAEGIPTARFMVITKGQGTINDAAREIIEELGLPVVVKAANQGSSIGIIIVKDASMLADALDEALKICPKVLVEQFIAGIEITASVLGNEEPLVLPLIEIETAEGVYDYQAKYTPGGSSHIIPARISALAAERVNELSKKIYNSFSCLGFSRIDFIIDQADQPYVLEVNNIPGMTELSLFPDAAAYAGINYEDLVEQIVQFACTNWGLDQQ